MVKKGFGIEVNVPQMGSEILCGPAFEAAFAGKVRRDCNSDVSRVAPVDHGQAAQRVAARV